MKVLLMHPDRDFELDEPAPGMPGDLARDLELPIVWEAMSRGDKLVLAVVQRALVRPLADPAEIRYRQAVLADCLEQPAVIRELYELAGEALAAPRAVWGMLGDAPRTILDQSVRKLEVLTGFLARLAQAGEEHAGRFASEGLQRLCTMLAGELDRDYLARVDGHLRELHFKQGLLMSARLTDGNRGTGYRLRRIRRAGWLQRLRDRSGFAFTIADRDEAGMRALSELESRAVNGVANAIAQSVDHVLAFVIALRTELAFYVGALNLAQELEARGAVMGMPVPVAPGERELAAVGLYDVALALSARHPVTANDLAAGGRRLVLITGTNQGGKSTFLRSLGLAQLMMQAGLFVGAASYTAELASGVFTHWTREEDATLERGKLDEELARMSAIADAITAGGLLLCNESFAATNEREGSQIAREVIRALLDGGIRVVFVTHLFDLASGLHREGSPAMLFLRAHGSAEGGRPFVLSEGAPAPTSHGEDAYARVFGVAATPRPPTAARRVPSTRRA